MGLSPWKSIGDHLQPICPWKQCVRNQLFDLPSFFFFSNASKNPSKYYFLKLFPFIPSRDCDIILLRDWILEMRFFYILKLFVGRKMVMTMFLKYSYWCLKIFIGLEMHGIAMFWRNYWTNWMCSLPSTFPSNASVIQFFFTLLL